MRQLVGRCAVALSGALWFLASLRGRFVADDYAATHDHPAVFGAFSAKDIFLREFWGAPFGTIGFWRPLATLSFWIDAHLGDRAPIVFHATNLVLFAAILWAADRLLARWLRRELPDIARWLMLAAFGAMTIHVDVVPSIVGRAELLAALFSILAIDAATDARSLHGSTARMAVFLLLAHLSKEPTLPMSIFCAWLAMRAAMPRRARLVRAGVALLGLVAMVAFRANAGLLRPRVPPTGLENPLIGQPVVTRLFGAFDVLARYLQHVLAPIDLCPDYGYAGVHHDVPHAAVGVLVVLVAALGFAWSFRRRPRTADALVGFAAAYVTVSHFLTAGMAVLADRLFFFPSFWLALIVALVLRDLGKASRARRRLMGFAAGGLVALQAVLTLALVPTRRDQHALTTSGVRTCPNVARIRDYRADAAYETHDPFEEAWAHLMAQLIEERFPRPIPEDEFPGAWEDEPLERRLQLLRAKIGPDSLRRAARLAVRRAELRRAKNAMRVLDVWSRMP